MPRQIAPPAPCVGHHCRSGEPLEGTGGVTDRNDAHTGPASTGWAVTVPDRRTHPDNQPPKRPRNGGARGGAAIPPLPTNPITFSRDLARLRTGLTAVIGQLWMAEACAAGKLPWWMMRDIEREATYQTTEDALREVERTARESLRLLSLIREEEQG